MATDIFGFDMSWIDDSDKKVSVLLNQIPKDTQIFVDSALEALAERLRQIIQFNAPKSDITDFNAPVRKIKYADSWTVEPPSGNTISVKSPEGLLFNMLEFTGRRPGRIHGNPILHFQIDGQDILVHWVDHPGFGPKPHVRNAIRQLIREAPKIIMMVLGETIRIYGAK